MSERWTPGPWSQSHRRGRDGGYNTEVYDAKGATIATLDWHAMPQKADGWISTDREANARLIAVAPDLYYVLNRLITELPANRDWLDPVTEEMASVVLAKARGEA